MGNLSHDRCYGTDKTTQKSGYGELTRLRKNSPTGSDTAYEGCPERFRFSACFVPVPPQVVRQTSHFLFDREFTMCLCAEDSNLL